MTSILDSSVSMYVTLLESLEDRSEECEILQEKIELIEAQKVELEAMVK